MRRRDLVIMQRLSIVVTTSHPRACFASLMLLVRDCLPLKTRFLPRWRKQEHSQGVLALGKGLSRQECEDTLVHECMHGLFYGHSLLQQAVNDHWQNVLSDNQRIAWIRFLVNHGYNAERDQELAVNELLAYMCTEKQLFSENSSQIQEVRSIRKDFVEAIQHQVPLPAPSVGQAGCIWEWPPSSALSAEVSKGRRSKRR
mmetsp:Transcript_8976/g.14697  ORF Transcript_8976/g.14697 Transcript_8976/m.14697 type:complete len:200 (+) Transcript_8976:540-1139(+)